MAELLGAIMAEQMQMMFEAENQMANQMGNQKSGGFGSRPLIFIEDPLDHDLHDDDEGEKAADVINTVKQASDQQEKTHNSPF